MTSYTASNTLNNETANLDDKVLVPPSLEEENQEVIMMEDGNGSSSKHQEPDALVVAKSGATEELSTPSSHDSRTSSMENHVKETRQLKGLAKQWDEEDRVAKGRAGGRHAHGHQQQQHASASDPQPQEQQEAQPLSARHRLTLSQEKVRNTYIRTGMKPGAYPDTGPYENETQDDRPYAVARRYLSNSQVSTSGGYSRESSRDTGADIEQGMVAEQPLVEAFVVPDEDETKVAPPPVKTATTTPTLVEGDYMGKAQMNRENSSSSQEVTAKDVLMHRNVLLLIACLVCCFVVATVIVVVVVMTVIVNNGDSSSSNALAATTPNGGGIDVTPTAVPILPELTTTEAPTLENQSTLAPEEDGGKPGDKPKDEEENNTHIENESVAPTEAPSKQTPTEDETPEPSTEAPTTTNPAPTASPQEDDQTLVEEPPATDAPTNTPATEAPATDQPTTSEPTNPPTQPPTTPEPTLAPPTTPPPTTPPPTTPEPTRQPTPEPTDPALEVVTTQAPTIASTTSSNNEGPTSLPPLDLDTTARVHFTVMYNMRDTTSVVNPSAEEQAALDTALVEFFSDAISQDLNLQSEQLISSDQYAGTTGGSWIQTAIVDFVFGGDLPPSQSVIDALEQNSNVQSYLMDVVWPTGPTFANTNGMQFAMDIPIYGVA